MDEKLCVKCQEMSPNDEKMSIVKDGIDRLIEYSCRTNNKALKSFLEERRGTDRIKIHRECQKMVYNRLKRKKSPASEVKPAKIATRKDTLKFEWKRDCFFCEKFCKIDEFHPDRIDWRQVRTLPMRDKIIKICQKRGDDQSNELYGKLLGVNDLVAVEARYHDKCKQSFYIGQSFASTPGRPKSSICSKNFDAVCDWLESEAEVHTLHEIYKKMIDIAGSEENVYSQKWLKKNLEDKYSDHIVFIQAAGNDTKVCLRNMVDYLVTEKWYKERLNDTEDEAERIVKTAAKIVMEDIRATNYENDFYPTKESISNINQNIAWLPPYLKVLIQHLVKTPLKQASLGQGIVQAARSKSCISPILFGTGLDVDHVFGSRWLLDYLNRLGFSLSYDEIKLFKQSVLKNDTTNIDVNQESFVQWSADNVDHNVQTLSGKGSFHAMGIICSVTSKNSTSQFKSGLIKREKLVKVNEVCKNKAIQIQEYIPSEETGLSKLKFQGLALLKSKTICLEDSGIDYLWDSAIFFRDYERPNWSGYMSDVSKGEYPGKSTILFLPIIDLSPSDPSCIYTTLNFVIDQAKTLNVKTPVLTFDQPLWLKATEVSSAKSMKIVLILGGFHLMMSFMGSVGSLMKGSGLSEALATCYGRNAIEHMMTGKAVSRAIRGHLLAASALQTKLLRPLFPDETFQKENNTSNGETNNLEIDFECYKNDEEENDEITTLNVDTRCYPFEPLSLEDLTKLEILGDKILNHSEKIENLDQSEIIQQLISKYKCYTKLLETESRTAKFWLQYINYISILKCFIKAERTGNWSLHLKAISNMINLFAATGHINYAKCARFHLQNMLQLKNEYPWVYEKFAVNGFHTVRRSDRFWAGIWTDLVIEQVLMRSLKSRGGLTRGRGVTESVRLIWLKTMHRCAEIHHSMSLLTNLIHTTSEQHVELGSKRKNKDNSDLQKIIGWFDIHEPFLISEPCLKSLSTGLIATEDINCDNAESIGENIQESLDNLTLEEAKISKKKQVKTLFTLQPGIKIDSKTVHIDPLILFSRLTAAIQRDGCVKDNFYYELTPEPTSLFKDGLMRKAIKSNLRNYLLNKVEKIPFHLLLLAL